jgi:phosphatidylserine/phosphatidylglycerophosphate/cardiolipin synthase-like enzyme
VVPRSPRVPRDTARVGLALALAFALAAGATPAAAAVPAPAPALASAPATGSTPGATNDSATGPRLVAVYPNPVADGDEGEFVVVAPAGVANLTLTDGETTVPVPATAGPVALASAPEAARRLTDRRVVAADLALSNGGEALVLRRNGRPTDTLDYEDAPEAERYTDAGWRPYGYRPRSVERYPGATATAFVLPDSPGLVGETLRAADDRLLLAGYTLTSRRVVDALVGAARHDVTVRVLVDAAPVGGRSARGAAALDRLSRAGVAVRAVGGPRARFAYHHPKYAVVDDRALVLTENWKPAGTGGRDSRGWGVRVDARPVADGLAALFARDFGAHDARPWSTVRAGGYERVPPANGSYPTRIDPRRVEADRVRLLTAPGNAEGAVVAALDGADRRIDVLQPTLGGPDGPFVRACLRAAARGVEVRILLSDAWYVAEENRALAARLTDRAERRGLPLSVRLAEPGGRYGKVHAKGVVVDETVVVGSLNWNAASARENREVALALSGGTVADYYRTAFERDWRGRRGLPPAGLALAAALAVGVALAYLRRRVSFG